MAQGPNHAEIYEQVRGQFRSILSSVNSEQHSMATPCTEWTVQNLINHALGVQRMAQGVLAPESAPSGGDVNDPLPADGAAGTLDSISDVVLDALKSTNLEETVETPFGSMPGGQFIMVPIADMMIHAWDVAKATGQSITFDEGLCEMGYNVLTQVAPGGRERGAFGPEVTVPADASFQDRMLGLSGRQP